MSYGVETNPANAKTHRINRQNRSRIVMHSLSTLFVRRICVVGVTAAIGVSAAPAHASIVPSVASDDAALIPTNSTSDSQFGVLQGMDGDISQLAYEVLIEATNDQNNDLQQIMNEVQAQTAAKQFLRG
jgi:hypothetical protein